MSPAVRRAAPVAAIVACVLAASPAHAQTVPAPTPGGEPPLSGEPPVSLGSPTPTPTAAPGATPTASATAAPADGEELARTGSDAGLLALAGVSLLSMGIGLRRLVAAHGER